MRTLPPIPADFQYNRSQLREAIRESNTDRIRSLACTLGYDKAVFNHQTLLLAVNSRNTDVVRCLVEECHADMTQLDDEGRSALKTAVLNRDTAMVICLIESHNSNDTLWLYRLCNTTWLNPLKRLPDADQKQIYTTLSNKIKSCPQIVLLYNLTYNGNALLDVLKNEHNLLRSIRKYLETPYRLAILPSKNESTPILQSFFNQPNCERQLIELIFDYSNTVQSLSEVIPQTYPAHYAILQNAYYHALWNQCHGKRELSRAKHLLREISRRSHYDHAVEFIDHDKSTSVSELIDRLIKIHILGNYYFAEGCSDAGIPKDNVIGTIYFIQMVCGLPVDVDLAANTNVQTRITNNADFPDKKYADFNIIWNQPMLKTAFDKAKAILKSHYDSVNFWERQQWREGIIINHVVEEIKKPTSVAVLLKEIEMTIPEPRSQSLMRRVEYIGKRCGLIENEVLSFYRSVSIPGAWIPASMPG